MGLPIKKENNQPSEDMIEAAKVLNNLTDQFFVGQDAEMLKALLSEFAFENITQFFETVFTKVAERVDLENLNLSNIEELDLISLAKDIASSLENDAKVKIQLSEAQALNFEGKLKDFAHTALHDVAFPMLALENPNAAESAKNLVKRTLASIQNDENVDISKIYEELDIENLPTEFSVDLFFRLGGTIPGLEQGPVTVTEDVEKNEPTVLHCELSIEQAAYLSFVLMQDYEVFKKWRPLYDILKSNGKKYQNVIVYNNKIGLLLSVISNLRERKTLADGRFIHTNSEKGDGIWNFFQGFLVDARTDRPFERELRKLRSENACDEDASKIVDSLFDPKNQKNINERAKELFKK